MHVWDANFTGVIFLMEFLFKIKQMSLDYVLYLSSIQTLERINSMDLH